MSRTRTAGLSPAPGEVGHANCSMSNACERDVNACARRCSRPQFTPASQTGTASHLVPALWGRLWEVLVDCEGSVGCHLPSRPAFRQTHIQNPFAGGRGRHCPRAGHGWRAEVMAAASWRTLPAQEPLPPAQPGTSFFYSRSLTCSLVDKSALRQVQLPMPCMMHRPVDFEVTL